MTLAPKCYAEDFADYVGSLEYHGLDGVERSTALYRALFDDLAFDVVDQVAEGDRVASRFVLTGSTAAARCVCGGSRSAVCATDGSSRTTRPSTELLKQLGLWRTALAAPRMLRALRAGRRNPSAAQ